MPINTKHINVVGKIIVDTLVLAILLAVTALPASTFSLLSYEENPTVLSEQDTRYYIEPLDLQDEEEEDDELYDDNTKTLRE